MLTTFRCFDFLRYLIFCDNLNILATIRSFSSTTFTVCSVVTKEWALMVTTLHLTQVTRTAQPIGINLSMTSSGGSIVPAQSSLRDVHHIVHDGPGPGPKTIMSIDYNVSQLLPTSHFFLFKSSPYLLHYIRVQRFSLVWRKECFCTQSMVRIAANCLDIQCTAFNFQKTHKSFFRHICAWSRVHWESS